MTENASSRNLNTPAITLGGRQACRGQAIFPHEYSGRITINSSMMHEKSVALAQDRR